MTRIDSIYCFDYTNNVGHYDSLRDFATLEMTYIGLAISTPQVHVDATPTTITIDRIKSSQIREAIITQFPNLKEISKDLAINSPLYILVCYCDGTKQYFEHDEKIYKLLKSVSRCEKKDTQATPKNNSPYIIKNTSAVPHVSYAPSQPAVRQDPSSYSTTHSTTHRTSNAKVKAPPFAKLLAFFALAFLLIVVATTALQKDTEKGPTPVSEPVSGTILSGIEVYNGSELTIFAESNESCVVKLKTSSGVDRLSFYVRAGDTVTVGVPSEYLYVYFATGKTWYGPSELFGEKTRYSMDDEILDFKEYTWEYTLYPVTDGNFSETPIDPEDF